jgi:carboxymethylenebutenolidase
MEQTITIDTADGPMRAFVASPDDGSRKPALIVCQEAFGVNDHIRNVCRRLAGAGYVALAPELFHRSGTGVELGYTDFSIVMPHFSKLTNETLTMDITAALQALRKDRRVDPSRVGVIGFCVGGFATFLAAEQTDAAAFVAFYGGGIVHMRPGVALAPLLEDADRITAPMLLLFGAEDHAIPPDDIAAIRDRLTALGKTFEIVVYAGAGHGFACDARSAFHAPSAEAAWHKTLEWLTTTL